MQLRIELATLLRSYFPKNDLIKEPYPDGYYREIWQQNLSQFKKFTTILDGVNFHLKTEEVAVINQLALVSQVTRKPLKLTIVTASFSFLLLKESKRITQIYVI
jgi:hypothetical protein